MKLIEYYIRQYLHLIMPFIDVADLGTVPGGGQEYRRELLERRRVSLPQDFAEGGLFTEPFPSAGGKTFKKRAFHSLCIVERLSG